MKKDKPFKFPMSLLKQLSECSNGFILFLVNEEGSVVPYVDLPNEAVARALNAYAANFAEAFKQVELDNLVKGMNLLELEEDDDSEQL